IPGPHGANMDFNEVVAGVTMQFPVFEPGALFMLGDGHAAQGDGEIDGAAIETSFDVKFTVNLIKGKKINWPHLINDNEIMSIGSTRPLNRCVAARLCGHGQLAGQRLRLRELRGGRTAWSNCPPL